MWCGCDCCRASAEWSCVECGTRYCKDCVDGFSWDASAQSAEQLCIVACQAVRDYYGNGTEDLCEKCGDKLFDHFRFDGTHECSTACSADVRWQHLNRACEAGSVEEAKAWVAEFQALTMGLAHVAYHAAAMHGHLHILQWAVAEHGVNLTEWYFRDNLHWCRHLHVMQWVVENGVHMDRALLDTCLARACGRPDGLPIVQWLCAQGADPHGAPFEHAAMYQRHIALWLVQREPEFPWPRRSLAWVMAGRCWSRARDVWVRSVVAK